MRRRRIASLLCLAALTLGGCAETLLIRSYPSGARATVNGEFVGVTPATLEVPRDQVTKKEYRWRVEKPHYEAAEGLVTPRIAPGRIVGAVFTLGILLAFRSPYYLPTVTAELPPVVAATAGESTEQRLEKIQRLHEKGLISEQEYERLRGEILDELRGAPQQ